MANLRVPATNATKLSQAEKSDGSKKSRTPDPFGIVQEDGSIHTSKGIEKPVSNTPPNEIGQSHDPYQHLEANPSFVEGLQALGNDEAAQGRYSIEYIERKAKLATGETVDESEHEGIDIASNVPVVSTDVEGSDTSFNQAGSESVAHIAQATPSDLGIPAEAETVQPNQQSAIEDLHQRGVLGSDGTWHFQNPKLPPGQDIAGAFKEWVWNTFFSSPSRVADNNFEFFCQFITGKGKTVQLHTDQAGDPVLHQFIQSPGAEALRKQFKNQGFPATTQQLGYGTWQAFEETVAPECHDVTPTGLPVWSNFKDWWSIGTQVGGFGYAPKDYPWSRATASRCNADGEPNPKGAHVRFSVINLAGRKSFLYHMDTPFTNDKPLGEGGPMRTIVQGFSWIEPIEKDER